MAPNQTLTKPKCTAVRLTAKQQALVVKFMPMVHSLAWRALKGRPKNILQEDLAAAGMIGLCEAARRFDETRGVSFMSYAWPYAQGYITNEIKRQLWIRRSRKGAEPQPPPLYLEDLGVEGPDGSTVPFDAGDDGASANSSEREVIVRDVLSKVSPSDRALADLVFHSDRDVEAARSLGISRQATSVRRHRLIEKLQRVAA